MRSKGIGEPSTIASRVFNACFGASSLRQGGEPAALAREGAYSRGLRAVLDFWKPGSQLFVFVGDITLSEATELARQSFGSWSGGAAPAGSVPAPNPAGPGKVFLVDRQDAAQTIVTQILPAPPRKSDEYFALTLADAVWGGGFGTRLNLNLREGKGYSYGFFSNPTLFSKSGAWRASGGVQTNKTSESVVELVKELKFLNGEKPISAAELDTRRKRDPRVRTKRLRR